LLRRGIARRIGKVDVPGKLLARLWIAALAAGAVGIGVRLALAELPAARLWAFAKAAAVFGSFGIVYLLAALALRVPEASAALRRVRRFGRA
jgi:hypothetical protein